jgi:hypothetical protein
MALSQAALAEDVVRLAIPDCESVAGSQIVKLVALELAPQITIAHGEAEAAALTATLECMDGRAVITVQDTRRSEPLQLVLPLADTRREARPRLLALAIAELIATSRLEPGATPAPPPPPPPPVTPPPERPLALGVGAGVVYAFEPTLWSPSLQIAAAYSLGSLQLQADIAFDWGSHSAAQANLDTQALSLALAPGLRLVGGDLSWHAGLGLRGGVVWLAATPIADDLKGRTVSGFFLEPLAWTALQLRLSELVYLRLAFELGYVAQSVRGLDADHVALLELRGVRAASWLGAGFRL